jgi:hypothetical protein
MQLAIIFFILAVALMLGYITTSGIKSQWIRVMDIIIIGPLMIYIGISNLDRLSYTDYILYLNYLLLFFGATTITYNLKNYIFISKNPNLD